MTNVARPPKASMTLMRNTAGSLACQAQESGESGHMRMSFQEVCPKAPEWNDWRPFVRVTHPSGAGQGLRMSLLMPVV